MFDDTYVEFDNATEKCEGLGARLPVLDSAETIKIVKRYLETSNFTVFEVRGQNLATAELMIWPDSAWLLRIFSPFPG